MSQAPTPDRREKVPPPFVALADLRGALGLTLDAVCEQVRAITDQSFTRGALSAIELGHRGASPETLSALEVVLRIKPGRLRTGYWPTRPRRKAEDPAA